MRKLISLFLVISFIVPMAALPASALGDDVSFIVTESFNGQVTGAVPDTGIASGSAKVTVTVPGKDKALELSGTKKESGFLCNVPDEASTLSVFFEIEYTGGWSKTNFYVLDSANKSFNLATVNTNGEIRSGDTRLSSVMSKGRKVPVQITYNKKYQKASIYVDNKCLTAFRYMGSSAPKTIGGFGVKVTGNPEYSCLIDNFAIFEGTKHIKSSAIPKASFSKEELVASSDGAEAEEFVGDTVYTNRTFDETDGRPEFEKVTVSLGGNRITIEESVFDGNKYIRLDKRGTKQGYISYSGNSSARYVVAQADFSTDRYTPSSQLFYLRDGNAYSMFCPLLNLAASTGRVTTQTGLYVCTIEPLKWVNVAVVTDCKDLTYDVYVDNKLVHEKVPFTNKTITAVPMFRTSVNATTGTGTLLIDNLKTYEGKEPRELKEPAREPAFNSESYAISLLGNMKALEPYNNNLFSDGKKSKAANYMKVELDDKLVYAHADDLKALLGDGAKLTSPHPDDANFYDVYKTGEASGYLVKNVDTRLFLFSKAPIDLNSTELDEVRRHMFHDRPSRDKLWEDYKKTSNGQHPRILINKADVERIKGLYNSGDPYMKKWGDKAIEVATSWLGKKEFTYVGSPTDGYADLGLTSMNPFMSLMFAYHFTGNTRYIDRAWKYAENMCLLEDWNPEVTFLDVGELSFQVGLCYDWLYDYITEEQRAFLAKNLLEKGVELFRKVYYQELDHTGWYVTFYRATNNWGAVTNGGVMCGAMALLDVYPETAMEVVYCANRCIEYMTGSYYPRGAWEEGITYWNYALQYLTYTMLSLENTFGSSYGLHNIPGLDSTGYYGSKITGATGVYTTGDASSGFINNRYIMSLAKRYGDAQLMATKLLEMEKYGHNPTALEMIFYDPALVAGEVDLSLDSYMEGLETISLREAWFDQTATYLGAHGGDNKRSHGHMDIGSFSIDMAGIRFIHDVGGENYNAKGGYFTTNRYRFYASRPEGHNLYIINPEEDNLDYFGQDNATVPSEIRVSKPRGAIATIDLSNAYKSWTNSALRGFMMSDDRRSITVRDEIDLKGDDNYIYWFVHTNKNVEYLERNTAVIEKDGKKMQITVDCDAPDWSFELVPSKTMSNVTGTVVKDTNKESQNYKTMAVIVHGASGKVNITAKFKLADDALTDPNPVDLPIAEWTIPDGEVTPLPTVDMIYADGEPIEDFDPAVGGYSTLVPNKETKVPTITVDTTNRYEISQSTEFGTDTLIKVYAPNNPEVYRTYRINFYKMAALTDIDGMRRYPVAEVTCVDDFEATSPPNNVIDQNFGTRWASESKTNTDKTVTEEWITLELDDIYPIEKVGISWMNGDSRVYKFKLEISEDGQKWTQVFNGSSKSGTTALEYTQLGGKKAKYVRYTGFGNSSNGWNSVTEIAVLGNER